MTERYLGQYSEYAYALLRIVAGFMFMLHGTQKLFSVPKGPSMPASAMMTAGGIIELVAGLMIMLGLFAGIAALIASGEMAVAYFMAHQPGGALPIQNGGELAALYCFVFLYIATRGSGVFSIDSLLMRRTADTDPQAARSPV